MGRSKQLLLLKGKPLISHSLDSLISSGIHDIVVVLGDQGEDVLHAVAGLPLRVVFNKVTGSDMAESLRTGLRAVDGSSTGILISLADQPLISSDTVKTLVIGHGREPDKILVPVYGTKRGHPVLLPKNLLETIYQGGMLRDIIKKYSGRVNLVPVTDEGIILDIDTMDDYRKIVTMVDGRKE